MYHGVLDPQPGRFGFALFDDDRKVFETGKLMRARDAADLPDFIENAIQEAGLKLSDIQTWTVGAGPGSFTFLRLIAALVAGWQFGNSSIKFRCIPGAVALAAALKPADGESVGVLYDGRNKELLYFGVIAENGNLKPSGETAILDAAKAAEFFKGRNECLISFENEKEAIEKILPPGCNLSTALPDLYALAASDAPFDNNPDNLVYIRPAVTG